MKNQIFLLVFIISTFVFGTMAQDQSGDQPKTKASDKLLDKKDGYKIRAYKANTADVKSIDAIIKATYDVISGDAGVERNWDRFHSLFHPTARLIPTAKPRNSDKFAAFPMTPKDYIDRSGSFLVKNGFHEQEISRKTEIFGTIAHVFSTYEGRNKLSDEKPFLRGINSFQLFNDGERWWVMSIFWRQESKETPVPEKYLKK